MTVYPGGGLAIIIALYSFYSFNRRKRNRRIERQNILAEKHEELLNLLREKENAQTKEDADERNKSTSE